MKYRNPETPGSQEDPLEKIKEGIVGMNLDGFAPVKWDEKTLTMGREVEDPVSGKKAKAEVIFNKASGEPKEAWVKDEEGNVLHYMNFEIIRERQEEDRKNERSRLN